MSALNGYPEEYLDCRDQHVWKTIAWYRADGNVHRIKECRSCTARRHDVWTRHGERYKASSYAYPEDYQIPGGVDRTEVRRALMQHAVIYPSWEAAQEATQRKGRK